MFTYWISDISYIAHAAIHCIFFYQTGAMVTILMKEHSGKLQLANICFILPSDTVETNVFQ